LVLEDELESYAPWWSAHCACVEICVTDTATLPTAVSH
jgi:hypothetical protein